MVRSGYALRWDRYWKGALRLMGIEKHPRAIHVKRSSAD
jgi:hypothetical protein